MDEKALRERISAPGPGATDLDVAVQMKQSEEKISSLPAAGQQNSTLNGKVEPMNPSAVHKKMVQILKEFTTGIAADKEMADFAKGKNVVFSFTIKDIDRAFFMAFIDGKVSAGLETPPRDPDVKLKMSADTLDGMFTGRVNATKAATSGKLSITGDTGKAMAFIRIQGDMDRLYAESRQKIGDPGDLTNIGATTTAAPVMNATPSFTPSPIQVAPGYLPAAPALVKTGDIRDQILQITNELFAKGMITATGGNISARCDDNPNEVWITPSAIFKGDLHPDMMVRINMEGKIIKDTDYTASSERRVHCAIYKNRPDITAVIHTHAPQATLMALTGTKFQPISADAAFLGDIPVVPFIMPGTDELGEEVGKAMLINGIAVLMQNHGLVVAGRSLRRAADMTDMIEITAEKLLTCRMMGVEPALLPEDVVKTLKDLGASMA
jgi:L-ribulose-5-phosphate 4-epimerase